MSNKELEVVRRVKIEIMLLFIENKREQRLPKSEEFESNARQDAGPPIVALGTSFSATWRPWSRRTGLWQPSVHSDVAF